LLATISLRYGRAVARSTCVLRLDPLLVRGSRASSSKCDLHSLSRFRSLLLRVALKKLQFLHVSLGESSVSAD
jgi:hypothetical protein